LGILPKTSGSNGTRRECRCARQDAWHGGQDARPPPEYPDERMPIVTVL
jgi:hypothetical protein